MKGRSKPRRSRAATAKKVRFQELWEYVGNKSMCALINGQRGWLMFIDDPEAHYSSREPSYKGDPQATIAFVLNNGQRDEYPASWTYPLELVLRALDEFRRTGERPPFIEWHRDG